MDPITIMALAQGIPALVQGATGAAQYIGSRRQLKDLKRPEMEIPDSAQAALAKAKSIGANFDLPGQDQAEMLLDAQLAGGASNIQETAGSSAEALGALQNLYANRMLAQTGMARDAAGSYLQRQQNIQNELGNMANWEQLQFNTNEMQPFLDKAAAASALGNAGINNLYQGISGITSAGISAGGTKYLQDLMGSEAATGTPAEQIGPIASRVGEVRVSGAPEGGLMTAPNQISPLLTPKAAPQLETPEPKIQTAWPSLGNSMMGSLNTPNVSTASPEAMALIQATLDILANPDTKIKIKQ